MLAAIAPTYQGRPVDLPESAFGSLQETEAISGDCPLEMGGLTILEGSHRNQQVLDYTELDVDGYCSNGPDAAAIEAGEQRRDRQANNGALEVDAIAVRERLGGRRLTSDFRAGDLLVFTMETMHAGLDRSDRSLSAVARQPLSAELGAKRRTMGRRTAGGTRPGRQEGTDLLAPCN